MIYYFFFSRYGVLALILTAIVLGLVFTPLQTLLMVIGGAVLLGGIVLLFVAAPYAALALPLGAALLIIGIRMQRKIDEREAEQIRQDAAGYARRNEFYVGPDR
ncbi:MAG: hypothetical protein IT449_11555 [Phycisphaerales bacterium]|nr:hypothetical protein [Phycisphaerales bacterium]